jgi:hypothetical protein
MHHREMRSGHRFGTTEDIMDRNRWRGRRDRQKFGQNRDGGVSDCQTGPEKQGRNHTHRWRSELGTLMVSMKQRYGSYSKGVVHGNEEWEEVEE